MPKGVYERTAEALGKLRALSLGKRNALKHGHARRRSATYMAWGNMIARCSNPKNASYKYYGGRREQAQNRRARGSHNPATVGVSS